jgi:hypothetical protein
MVWYDMHNFVRLCIWYACLYLSGMFYVKSVKLSAYRIDNQPIHSCMSMLLNMCGDYATHPSALLLFCCVVGICHHVY